MPLNDSKRRLHDRPDVPGGGNRRRGARPVRLAGHIVEVLRGRWRVYATAGKWDACLDIATELTRTFPMTLWKITPYGHPGMSCRP